MRAFLTSSSVSPRHVCRTCSRQLKRSLATAAKSTPPDIYDVVCVGGGPAGLSLLAALRANPTTSSLRVALVEAQNLSRVRSWSSYPASNDGNFSNRCSSLTPASVAYLRRVGAWRHLRTDRVQPYHAMQVWDGVSGARIEFEWAPGEENDATGSSAAPGPRVVAYMTENLNLTSGLLSRLDELGGVDVFDQSRVEGIELGEDAGGVDLTEWPVVQLAGGRRLHARLLVGADGANSPVRAFAGIESDGWDYGRHGVVATLELAPDAHHHHHEGAVRTAYQRFLPTGPVAMLPMPGGHATLVWSTTPANAARLKSLAAKDFVAMVNAAFRLRPADLEYMHGLDEAQAGEYDWRLHHTPVDAQAVPSPVVGVQEGSVASFPLKLRHASSYVSERVALVGDAAHTIHPLAGQGLNQGQGDVQSLAQAIEYAVGHGLDIGTQMSLESYNAERYAANHVLLGVCDKLHKLYSVESGPIVGLRSVGLRAVNALGPLKDFFMNQASGGARLF